MHWNEGVIYMSSAMIMRRAEDTFPLSLRELDDWSIWKVSGTLRTEADSNAE